MKALIVYESMFGNTEAIAHVVAERLKASFDVTLADVRVMPPVGDADLLIVGAPTHAFSMSRPRTRADAIRHGTTVGAGVPGIGIREYLDYTPWLTGMYAAAFDTRMRKPLLPGSAACKAYRRLHALGCHMVAPPKSFHVVGITEPLIDGEPDQARRWADAITATVLTARRTTPAA
ncbi:flavodoxin family protein [Actinoplanes xinjiangensis]|uniref:Flavodoxin-like protein n=1 Tax=Actinoplanes xinjiangensis TaxID=512350 RepID=A0A316F5Q9_9ACTN|nr:flavodoxin [Actinoplanes xinjiangensis]PWK39434.1 flavodoxin-like protein [Actinoplanes xinjiangensis]GIF42703.1 hypothetical protein Axi01nite_70140 [Actinoplanes xinjiangensis]